MCGGVDRYHIRAVNYDDQQLIVLDSGADISLRPYRMWKKGKSTKMLKAVLEDAQGTKVETFGRRIAQIEYEVGNDGLVVIETILSWPVWNHCWLAWAGC